MNAAYRAQYNHALNRFKEQVKKVEDLESELEKMQKFMKENPNVAKKFEGFEKVTRYPALVAIKDFNWEDKNFICPVCFKTKVNKYYTIWAECFHVTCDACTRQWNAKRCPSCNTDRDILKEGEPSPENSLDEMDSVEAEEEDEEEEKVPDQQKLEGMSRDELINIIQGMSR